MNKTKSKKGILKGVAVGFAFVLCSAFFPTSAVATLAEDWVGKTEVNQNANRIEVDGDSVNEASKTVKKGDNYVIPVGEYYGKSTTAHLIGSKTTVEGLSSSVVVTYQATGDVVKTISDNENVSAMEAESFKAEKLGTYLITYTVVENGVVYTYDLAVNCEASEASFEFSANEKNIIPSVYDVKSAKEKNIVLPLPKVNDEDGEVVLSAEDSEYYVLNKNGSGIPNEESSKKCYVYISLISGDDSIEIEQDSETGEFYIDGSKLSAKTESGEAKLEGYEFKVNYAFYQVQANGGTFITSTSKTFTVEDGYYYKDKDSAEENREYGYDLVTSWSTTVPDSAVVGVEKVLPSITGKTKATNSPANENVDVYYKVKVIKMNNNGSYVDDEEHNVTEQVITKDGKFKAVEEGSYRFYYDVYDFYGNSTTSSSTTFTIDKVRDTQSPDVYMYDAGDFTINEKGAYSSAESKLKTQTAPRNVIMYAIAGVDNMPSNTVTLRREIRNATGIRRFIVSEQKYNEYNLIFAPTKSDATSVYQQIVADNFEVARQLLLDEKDLTDANIKAWLKENNYLLVTTNGKNIEGNDIVEDLKAEDVADKMIEAGYAYIPAETTNGQHDFAEETYSFYYYASDNINNNSEKSVYYNVKFVANSTDASVPTITFSSNLQNAYLPNETIEFNVASASDTTDSRLTTVTAYRFLKNKTATSTDTRTDVPAGKEVVANDLTKETLKIVYESANEKDADKWYVKNKTASGIGLVESAGWYVNENESTYKIDLKDVNGAEFIEILCYSVDDYGNAGFFNKIISIADAADEDMPSLYRVVGAPEAGKTYEAPKSISLPTLYFTDAKVEHMHADVVVYKVTDDGRQVMQSTGMNTKFDTLRGIFTVDAGIFNASTEGKYQVAVTVSDSGNHSVTTYFDYNVNGNGRVETPEINPINFSESELAIDQTVYLPQPTLSVSDSSTWGYIGLGDNDDSNVATYYTTTMISASSNNYELDRYYFTGKAKGTYKLRYDVFLIQYNKTEAHFASTLTAGKMSINEKGQLVYRNEADTKTYYIYLDENEENEDYKLQVYTNTLGVDGTSLADDNKTEYEALINDSVVTFYVLPSAVQTLEVKDVAINISIDADAYSKDQYAEVGSSIDIVKPEVRVSGADKGNTIDKEESFVQVTITTGSTTQTLATIKFSNWEEAVKNDPDNFEVNGSDIKLKLTRNGRYTIRYSVQAQDYLGQNVGDAKTLSYTIANGDVVAPTIEFAKDFVQEKYSINDTLSINIAGITVSDKVTTERKDLLETIKVKLTNEDTSESWNLENTSTVEGDYTFEKALKDTGAGDYTLTISVTDKAGNTADKSVSFTVSTDTKDPVNVKEVLGGVLIGVSVAILAGVVIYFVVSKVKLDKRAKGYQSDTKDKDKD